MILSVSRRTDIPAFYSEWFFNRINEGFVLVRNPMNDNQISKVSLTPDIVDCIVFWSKNPKPFIPYLDKLNKYHYYFQFTLNSYGQDIETSLPKKREIIDTFKKLSDKIGNHRVIWRYDPILFNEKYTISYHAENFYKIAYALKGYAEKVTISFIDFYTKIERNLSGFKIEVINSEIKHDIAKQLAHIAHENSFIIDTCAEDIELSQYEITHARCIDDSLIKRIIGCSIDIKKDKTQRLECGCVASVDIGAYNTCRHGCLYCYANFNHSVVLKNTQSHNKLSPLLIGKYSENDKYIEREAKSDKIAQKDLF